MVRLISLNENLLFGLILPSRSKLLVFKSSPMVTKLKALVKSEGQGDRKLTCMDVCQINHVRRVVHNHHGQIAIETQRPRLLQSNGLYPLAGLSVENVDVRL